MGAGVATPTCHDATTATVDLTCHRTALLLCHCTALHPSCAGPVSQLRMTRQRRSPQPPPPALGRRPPPRRGLAGSVTVASRTRASAESRSRERRARVEVGEEGTVEVGEDRPPVAGKKAHTALVTVSVLTPLCPVLSVSLHANMSICLCVCVCVSSLSCLVQPVCCPACL